MAQHSHEHGHSHRMSVYEFLGRILLEPLDETLLYNVCDTEFWDRIRPDLFNPRTIGALNSVDKAAARIANVPVEERDAALSGEYALMFSGEDAWMPPYEHAYGMKTSNIRAIARSFGVASALPGNPADDHIASELLMLVPIDAGMHLTREKLVSLAAFFEEHPIALAQNMLVRLSAQDDTTSGFYRSIVELTLAWLRYDLDAFN